MGKFISSIASFCDKAKSFGKKVFKVISTGLSYCLRVLLTVLGVVYFGISNVIVAVTATIWMPIKFVTNPQWLVDFIETQSSDKPEEFLIEAHHLAVFLYGWFWKWLGSRVWATRRQRAAFIPVAKKEIAKYPVRVQVQFWQDTSNKAVTIVFLSEEARQKVLSTLVEKGEWNLVEECLRKLVTSDASMHFMARRCTFKSLIHILYDMKSKEKDMVLSLFNKYPMDKKEYQFDAYERNWLYVVSSEAKLFIFRTFGMSLEDLRGLLDEKDGVSVLRDYIGNGDKTLSKEQLSVLLKKAKSNGEVFTLVKEIVFHDGLSSDHVEEVRNSMNNELVNDIEDLIKAYADKSLINGVSSSNLTKEEQDKVNITRWEAYCRMMDEIHPLAQPYMNLEQYKIFVEAGHVLNENALKKMLVEITDKRYFREVIFNEFENIDEDLITLFASTSWKYACLVDVTAEKDGDN